MNCRLKVNCKKKFGLTYRPTDGRASPNFILQFTFSLQFTFICNWLTHDLGLSHRTFAPLPCKAHFTLDQICPKIWIVMENPILIFATKLLRIYLAHFELTWKQCGFCGKIIFMLRVERYVAFWNNYNLKLFRGSVSASKKNNAHTNSVGSNLIRGFEVRDFWRDRVGSVHSSTFVSELLFRRD